MELQAFGAAVTKLGTIPTYVEFMHANLRTRIIVVKETITGFYRSEAQKCTYLVTTSNTIFPALESVDEVIKKLGLVPAGEPTNG